MEKIMFNFWHISPKWAFAISVFVPAMFLMESILRGVIFDEPLMTLALVVAPFYLINGLLKVVDDLL